jgi:hypothetical protein
LEDRLAQAEAEKATLMARLESSEKEALESKVALADAKAAKAEAALQAQKASAVAASRTPVQAHEAHGMGTGIGEMSTEELDATHYDVIILGGGPVGVSADVKCA